MNPGIVLAVALAGGAGAGARYLIDRLLTPRRGGRFPLGILVVNITGSFALGVVTGAGTFVAPDVAFVAAAGFLGGYTTFSAVSVESVLLAERRRWRDAAAYLLSTLVLAVAGAAAGVAIGLWLAGIATG